MLNIGFISEYFPPYAPGGAEWSSFFLARNLSDKGHKIVVITPNYGALSEEVIEGVRIYRFPFYFKLSKSKLILNSFHHTNPLWIIWSSIQIYKYARKSQLQILHIQGKYSIIPTFLANYFLKLPILLTIRDYQIICNYGFCLYFKNKSCNISEYFNNDFRFYLKEYVDKSNLFIFLFNLLYAIWGRINCYFLKIFSKNMNIIVLSKKQKEIFLINGFKKIWIIGNSTDFLSNIKKVKKEKILLFAGRLSHGKGVQLLINIIPAFFKKFPDFKIVFAGEGKFKKKLLLLKKRYTNIIMLGQVKHNNLIKLYRRSMVVVVPSIWQEPFGRIALEAIAALTPAVVTNNGGLPEIIKNEKWGYVVEPKEAKLLLAIEKAIKNNRKLVGRISEDYNFIKNKFGEKITNKYLRIYKSLL